MIERVLSDCMIIAKKKTISEDLSRIYTQKKITKLKVENYLFDKFEKIPHVRLAKYYEKNRHCN